MRGFDFKRYGPVILIVFLVVTPLAIWAATSGGSEDGKQKFYVERSVGLTGAPELLITIDDPEVEITTGSDSVEVKCTDGKGNVIVDSKQPWPFPLEAGYPPHAHQVASVDDVEQARRCSVSGTNKKLEAEVR